MAEYTPTELEKRWAQGWVKGLAKVLAEGPPGESPILTEEQRKEIERIALQPGSEVYQLAKRWYNKMREIFAPAE